MVRPRMIGVRSLRRCLPVSGSASVGIVLLATAVAWACTIHIGVLTVCSPPNSSSCVTVTGNESPSGSASVSQGGSSIQVGGSQFRSLRYTIRFRAPESGANCHTGGTRLGRAVRGPSWNVLRTTPATSQLGPAELCVQEASNPSGTGNMVPLTVV